MADADYSNSPLPVNSDEIVRNHDQTQPEFTGRGVGGEEKFTHPTLLFQLTTQLKQLKLNLA